MIVGAVETGVWPKLRETVIKGVLIFQINGKEKVKVEKEASSIS